MSGDFFFYPAVGRTGVIFVRYQQPLFFGLVSSYLRLYLGMPCLRSFSVATELRHVWRCKQRAFCLKEQGIGAASCGYTFLIVIEQKLNYLPFCKLLLACKRFRRQGDLRDLKNYFRDFSRLETFGLKHACMLTFTVDANADCALKIHSVVAKQFEQLDEVGLLHAESQVMWTFADINPLGCFACPCFPFLCPPDPEDGGTAFLRNACNCLRVNALQRPNPSFHQHRCEHLRSRSVHF